jgi:hypothetical protein
MTGFAVDADHGAISAMGDLLAAVVIALNVDAAAFAASNGSEAGQHSAPPIP